MDYGDTYSDSAKPLQSQSADVVAINVANREVAGRNSTEADPAVNRERQGNLKIVSAEAGKVEAQAQGGLFRQPDKVSPRAALNPATGLIACEIKHPLSAIVANAHAARRWLQRPDANLAEALAALDRIVRDSARIDEMI